MVRRTAFLAGPVLLAFAALMTAYTGRQILARAGFDAP